MTQIKENPSLKELSPFQIRRIERFIKTDNGLDKLVDLESNLTSLSDELKKRYEAEFKKTESQFNSQEKSEYELDLENEKIEFKKKYLSNIDELLAKKLNYIYSKENYDSLSKQEQNRLKSLVSSDEKAKELAKSSEYLETLTLEELIKDNSKSIGKKYHISQALAEHLIRKHIKEEELKRYGHKLEMEEEVEKFNIDKLNVGVVDLSSGNSKYDDFDIMMFFSVNREFFDKNTKLAEKTLLTYYLPILETSKTPKQAEEELNKEILSDLSNLEKEGKASFAKTTYEHLKKYIEHWKYIQSLSVISKKAAFHQANRMYEMTSNGTNTLMIGDSTSGGKTFTSVGILGLLQRKNIIDSKNKKSTLKNYKTIVFARNQTMGTVWSNEKIKEYYHMVGITDEFLKENSANNSILPKVDLINTVEDLKRIQKSDSNFVVINYEKMGTENVESKYIGFLEKYVEDADLIVCDEFQNIKNVTKGKRSRNIANLIDDAKSDSRMCLLSATPVMNRLKDFGMMLYYLGRNKNYYEDGTPVLYTIDGKELIEKRIEHLYKRRNAKPILEYNSKLKRNPNRISSWVKDGVLYTSNNKRPHIHINPNRNLVFENIEEAYRQLTQTGNYFPSKEKIKNFLSDKDTRSFDLLTTGINECDAEFTSFFIDGEENKEIRELRNTVYPDGYARVFKGGYAAFYILTPNYILKNIKDEDSAIARVCCMDYSHICGKIPGYDFYATNGLVVKYGGSLVSEHRR